MPSHLMEGEDWKNGSGALVGERIFGDADPATALRQYQANALWHGLRTLLKGEQIGGDLTASSGAADQAEGYIRLAKALRRMARRFQPSNLADLTVNSGNVIFTPAQDVFVYHLIDDSPVQPETAKIHPNASDLDMKNRVILVVNLTSKYRLVGNSYYGIYARLAPRESCFLYAFHEVGSGTIVWHPVGHPVEDVGPWETFSAQLYGPGGNSAATDVQYRRIGKRIDMVFSQMVFTTTGGGDFFLRGAGSTAVPDILTEGMPAASSGDLYSFGNVPVFSGSYKRAGFKVFTFGGGPSRQLLLHPFDASYFPAGPAGISNGQMSYFLP